MSNLLSYSPEDITILLAGVIPLDGYIDGTFVEIEKLFNPYSSTTSSDGITARTYRNSQEYIIRLTLHNTSPSNDVLTKLWLLDELTQTGKFPLLIKDQLGSSLFFSTTSWIEGIPVTSFANSITERTWVIHSSQAVINIGGNDAASGLIEDLTNSILGAAPILQGVL
jgi:hypothetical protein